MRVRLLGSHRAEEKAQSEPAADMDDDVSLSGSDDGMAGNGHASAMQVSLQASCCLAVLSCTLSM